MPKDKAPAAAAAPALDFSEKRRKPRTAPGPTGPRPRKETEKTSDTLATGKNMTLGQWIEIFDFVDSHPAMTQKQVENHFRAKGYKLTQSMLSRKLKEKDVHRARALTTPNALESKRPRVVTCPEVERALVLWFQGMEARGEIVNGSMLVEKRARFEKAFNVPSEQCMTTDGWTQSFKRTYGIKEHRRHGEAGSVDPMAVSKEQERLQPIIAEYAPDDVFNGDEGALFAYAPPDRGLSTKVMSGKKAQKFRITLFFVCNSTGTQKEPLMYIGKSTNPRCFKQIPARQRRQFYYRNNTKAWMTAYLFEEWVKAFDRKMRLAGRHVLLTLDNFAGHIIAYKPTNVRIEFLAPNMTSRIQPLDAGIIRTFKAYYRREFCKRALDADEAGDDDIWKLNLWQAMNMARDAWDQISSTTIQNCWAHTGILPPAPKASGSTAGTTAAASTPSPDSAAWSFLLSFVTNDAMTLPEAQNELTRILGAAAANARWQKALGIANDVEPDDEAAQIAARATLEKMQSASQPRPVTHTPHAAQLLDTDLEKDLGDKIDQLVKRKLVRRPLTIDEFLDPVEEQQVGEGVHELVADTDIVAAVQAEYAAKAAATDAAAEDSDDDDDDPAAHLSVEAIISLCNQLETACIARGVENAPQLRTELLNVKRQLRQTQLQTAKQSKLDSFLVDPMTHGSACDPMDVDTAAPSGPSASIVID